MSNPWLVQPPCDPYEGETEVSDRPMDSLAQFIRMADGRHELGAGALAERIAVEWLPDLLAEAERRGAEKGWDEGLEAWADRMWDGDSGQQLVNPYRAGADQ